MFKLLINVYLGKLMQAYPYQYEQCELKIKHCNAFIKVNYLKFQFIKYCIIFAWCMSLL